MRLMAEEQFADKQDQEIRVVQIALSDFESGSASTPLEQATGSLSIVQAVHETLLAQQQLAQEQLKEVELIMQVIRDDIEDLRNQIALSTQQVGDLLQEMGSQGIHPTTMNAMDDYTNTDGDNNISDGTDDDSEGG
jgi:chromosome segregation ATPase